ncbi:hypothetical protein [Streptacidiphilus sp. EB103A]|uniref:hypothetical protein n=1 Tax=Streptacidiphilus sp. EB103A TaxID=3156275 RepID=UPI0035126174
MDSSGISRRVLVAGTAAGLTAGLTAGAAGCSSNRQPSAAGSTSAPPTASTPSSSAPSSSAPASSSAAASPSAAPLPSTTLWQPSSNDIDPQVKLRAVQLIEALGAWSAGQQGTAAARAKVSALGLDPSLAAQAGGLTGSAPQAALQVLEAQYGGILTDTASVMVVCRQWTRGASGAVVPGGTTVDVRLSRSSPRWTVTALHPAQPGAAAASLPSAAEQVLSSSSVTLPPAAEADIRSGQIHSSVLDALLTLARSYRIELSVVRSGHPLDVFGTTRPSDHPQGRAFDVWRINGHAVVDPATSRSLIEGFMRAAAAVGSYNVGGPWQLSGGTGNQFFSDNTHHDHVHVGFSS